MQGSYVRFPVTKLATDLFLKRNQEKLYLFLEKSPSLNYLFAGNKPCFQASKNTKNSNFSISPTRYPLNRGRER